MTAQMNQTCSSDQDLDITDYLSTVFYCVGLAARRSLTLAVKNAAQLSVETCLSVRDTLADYHGMLPGAVLGKIFGGGGWPLIIWEETTATNQLHQQSNNLLLTFKQFLSQTIDVWKS